MALDTELARADPQQVAIIIENLFRSKFPAYKKILQRSISSTIRAVSRRISRSTTGVGSGVPLINFPAGDQNEFHFIRSPISMSVPIFSINTC